MKLEFDDLRLLEAKLLLDVLTAFRSNQPFAWSPPNGQPQLVKDKEETK